MKDSVTMTGSQRVCCRQIDEADLGAVTDLLTRGYDNRPRGFWAAGLARLARRDPPRGFPRFGYVLDCDGTIVGILLVIAQSVVAEGQATVRCNLSSWYVEPAFRSYAAMLSKVPLRDKTATYTNISPIPPTWRIIESQGFRRYTEGQFVALPAFSRRAEVLHVERYDETNPKHRLSPYEATLFADHNSVGCLRLIGLSKGVAYPFVFLPFRIRGGRFWFPGMQLVYCRSTSDFRTFARPIGRILASVGKPFAVLDTAGPLEGVHGYFRRDRAAKYFKGTKPPILGDLSYTELTIFGP